jgi:hypothetical protein
MIEIQRQHLKLIVSRRKTGEGPRPRLKNLFRQERRFAIAHLRAFLDIFRAAFLPEVTRKHCALTANAFEVGKIRVWGLCPVGHLHGDRAWHVQGHGKGCYWL